ncbi:MAG: CRISPR system Cascade subunit CasD [Akkermansiaceae bacterium]|jgi:CRISPR system Cascade subunit CasD
MSAEAHLVFLIHSPMQAWGASSRFPRRDTPPHPTKSGIIGMVAAALGIDKFSKTEAEELEPLRQLKLSTYAIPRRDRWGNNLPVNRLQDFHTIGGGFDAKNPAEKEHLPRKAGGGSSSNAVITRRDYLLDSCFLIALTGDPETLEKIPPAIANPKWGTWLGRKCCIPSLPIVAEKGIDLQVLADKVLEKTGLNPAPLESFDRTLEEGGNGAFGQLDQPAAYAARDYQTRTIRRFPAKSMT